MKIQFINHSSFIVEYKEVKLICDPWMEGKAFNNGWNLLSETKFKYEDFNEITHIWFSHEHPDHFSPPNLLKIPKEVRSKITVLYQETTDKKVAEFCAKVGFKDQIELKSNTYHSIVEGFEVMCNPYTDGDSYAVFKTEDCKLLNLNDCIVNSEKKAEELSKLVGEVDVLFTQFGYANKVGNEKDVALRNKVSKQKLTRLSYQIKHLKPKVIVPFASFVYFCHTENKYMNNEMNRIDTVHDFIAQELNTPCLVMYPNDKWVVGEEFDSKEAIQNYLVDYSSVENGAFVKNDPIEETELINESKKFVQQLSKGYPKRKSFIESLNAKVYVSDYQKSFELNGKDGLQLKDVDEVNCDISLSSSSLIYVFKELWGGDTLNVNARFQTPENGNNSKFRIFGNIAASLNRQEEFPVPPFFKKLVKKLKSVVFKEV